MAMYVQGSNSIFLLVRSVPNNMRQKDLETIFSKYGRLTNVTVNSNGIFFIGFTRESDMKAAVEDLKENEWGFSVVEGWYRNQKPSKECVKEDKSFEEEGETKSFISAASILGDIPENNEFPSLRISNASKNMSKEAMSFLCSLYGKVKYIYKCSFGNYFVGFESEEKMKTAVSTLNLNIRGFVAYENVKGERPECPGCENVCPINKHLLDHKTGAEAAAEEVPKMTSEKSIGHKTAAGPPEKTAKCDGEENSATVVGEAGNSEPSDSAQDGNAKPKSYPFVFVRNVPLWVKPNMINYMFIKYGPVIRVSKNAIGNYFVYFRCASDMKKAAEDFAKNTYGYLVNEGVPQEELWQLKYEESMIRMSKREKIPTKLGSCAQCKSECETRCCMCSEYFCSLECKQKKREEVLTEKKPQSK